jgi:hypothetical protein
VTQYNGEILLTAHPATPLPEGKERNMTDIFNAHYYHAQSVRAKLDEHIWGRGTPGKDLKFVSMLVKELQQIENEAYALTQHSSQ